MSEDELKQAAKKLSILLNTKVKSISLKEEQDLPLRSGNPLFILPDVRRIEALDLLYGKILRWRDEAPDIIYLQDGRIFTESFDACLYVGEYEQRPRCFLFEQWMVLIESLIELLYTIEDVHQRNGIIRRKPVVVDQMIEATNIDQNLSYLEAQKKAMFEAIKIAMEVNKRDNPRFVIETAMKVFNKWAIKKGIPTIEDVDDFMLIDKTRKQNFG